MRRRQAFAAQAAEKKEQDMKRVTYSGPVDMVDHRPLPWNRSDMDGGDVRNEECTLISAPVVEVRKPVGRPKGSKNKVKP